ncbi:MAG: hypothetical protein NTV54_10265 [Ignavibacteriales bacterium]|nr:hypothetical protein [Ignavibacteriales bacterium]
MKKITLLLLLCTAVFSLHTQPKQLKNFDELMASLKSGHSVRTVIYYAKCTLIADSQEVKAPDAIGGMELRTYEYFAPGVVRNPKGYLTTSETVLISHPRYGYVQNYVKMKIFDDDRAEIVARYLKPGTLEIVMDEMFKGTINNGKDDGGIFLFEN